MNICLPRKATQGLACPEKTKCQTHLKKFADINYMIERALGGDSSVFRRGSFIDTSAAPEDYQEFLNLQRKAAEAYEALPESVRARYTSPESFYAAANDSTQRDEFARLGLLINKPENGPVEVKIVNPEGVKASTPPPAPSNT